MTITVGTPGGPFVIGPGAFVTATSDLLGLGNGPYRWQFDYTGPDTTFHFTQDVITDEPLEQASHTVLWSSLEVPSDLLATIHAKLNDPVQVRVTVRDVNSDIIDQVGPITVQWDPTAWLNFNTRLWTDFAIRQIAGVPSSDQLDRIEAAVYRRFPNP